MPHIQKKIPGFMFFVLSLFSHRVLAQHSASQPQWIRPANEKSPPVWGIQNGIVVGLWPAAIETGEPGTDGGPRGLLRLGYNFKGETYLVNYIAVEPVVKGDMEFSEVSPSRVDKKLGKYFWASGTAQAGKFSPIANTRGVITHPDPQHPAIEELLIYVFMEQFLDGAYPYLKVSIRSDNPGELGIQLFNQPNSAKMERCALTATMGNYSRLRLLYLKDSVVDSRQLYAGYNDIDFAEKEPYSYEKMLRNSNGDYFMCAESNETFKELAAWPQTPAYQSKWGWHYRLPYKLTQYWRIAQKDFDPSLQVRVNGRKKYWSGEGNTDTSAFVNVPGGPAFENFELRENYHPGQQFFFGLSRKPAEEFVKDF
jgi:hypothetical protein